MIWGRNPFDILLLRSQRLRSRKESKMKAEIVRSGNSFDLIVKGYGWREVYADFNSIQEAVAELLTYYPNKDIELEINNSIETRKEVV
jgi:hypothetical protein